MMCERCGICALSCKLPCVHFTKGRHMSPKAHSLARHSVKFLLNETFLSTLKNISTHLSDFLKSREPESLHQYRINIRMARSICVEFSAFIDKKRKKTLEDLLKVLQKETNDMRDIDVFLEYIEAYKKRVDSSLSNEFESIKAKLEVEKEHAYKAFKSKYTETFQADIVAKLHAIESSETLSFPKSKQKLFLSLQEIFESRLKKIAKSSKKLNSSASNAQFHTLRLHYKKLRYTSDALNLEQFSKSFKPIQNAFGSVQDKNSQIERIKRYNTEHNKCLEHIIALLEEELVCDKQACITKSSQKNIRKMRDNVREIFTSKKK